MLNVVTHSIAVESIEDPRNVAAQDPDGNAGVVQRQPAAARLFQTVAWEQMVSHWTQHADLEGKQFNFYLLKNQ